MPSSAAVHARAFIGPTGPTGPAGTGATGGSGFSGFSGKSGFSGFSSTSGFSGYSGGTGSNGASGFSGYSGGTGSNGASGFSGYSGYSGKDGTSVSLKGAVPNFASLPGGAGAGDLWITTDTGHGWVSDGLGNWNDVGPIQGPQGNSGFSGYSGNSTSGFSGYSGQTGSNGQSGFSGYSGQTGSNGASGFSGYSGVNGQSGFSGFSGQTGSNGQSGFSGQTGSNGQSGFSGFSGQTGSNGVSGFSGYSGLQGPSGFSGFSGQTGSNGTSGFSGYSGQTGSNGTSGFSGYSGQTGSNGASGFSGYSGTGTSGFSGYSSSIAGPSGFSGYSGFSGVGTSGFSGYSGAQGTSGFSGSVTDGMQVPLGTPSDGSLSDGINAWTSSTKVTDALDDCNEILFYLAPANASPLSGALTMAGTTLFTGFVSQGNTNYKTGLGAGSSYANIINDPTFTLTNNPAASTFNYADTGYSRWYSAVGTNAYGAFNDSVDHAANFVTGTRAGTQLTTPWTSGQISVTLVSWYNSFPLWQRGNATITITAAQLSQGYNRIKMTREGTFTTQTSNDYEVFYDTDVGASPSVSGTPTVVEGTTVNTMQLSGVKFYDRGTQFKIGAVGLDCFDNTYVLNPLVITSSNSNAIGNASIPWNDATVTGVSNPPAINDTMTVTDKIISVPASNVRSIDARVTITPSDPYGSYSAVQSVSAGRLINGYINTAAGTSSDIGEFFDDEWYRMLSNFSLTSTSYSSAGAGGWDSTISLVSGTAGYDGLQVYNGGLKYPTQNYTSGFLPSSGQVNYSAASGNRVYIRYFYVGTGIQTLTFTIANQSGTTNFVSVATGPSSNNLTFELLAPNTTKNGSNTVEFKDCFVSYTADTAIGCYASGTKSSTTSNWACSLGTKSTATSGNVVVIRITASSGWTGALETISVVGS